MGSTDQTDTMGQSETMSHRNQCFFFNLELFKLNDRIFVCEKINCFKPMRTVFYPFVISLSRLGATGGAFISCCSFLPLFNLFLYFNWTSSNLEFVFTSIILTSSNQQTLIKLTTFTNNELNKVNLNVLFLFTIERFDVNCELFTTDNVESVKCWNYT